MVWGFMKKRRVGLVQKCLIALFLVTTILLFFSRYTDYYNSKKDFILSKRIEIKLAMSIIKARVNRIESDINAIANDLTSVFNTLNPSDKNKTQLITAFGVPALIYGLGYVELLSENAYSEYIYKDKSGYHQVNIKEQVPDYYTHPWFINPEKTKKPYVETPTINQIGSETGYMITYSYPYIDIDNKFKGVFVFDLLLEWLTGDLDEYIMNDHIDVSMFFPEDGDAAKIEFIKNTKIKILSNQKLLKELISLVHENKGVVHFKDLTDNVGVIGTVISIFDEKAFVMATFNKETLMKGLRNILYNDFLFGVIVLFFLFVCFYFILKYAFKPIEKISQNVIQISKGNLDVDVSVKSGAIEVIRLNEAIHKMQIQLKRYVEKMKKTAELDTELKIAANIQKSVIPKPISAIKGHPNIDLFQYLKPAKEASGDFYDYFMLDDENLFLSIGDVTGKGVPASLFTVMMISMEKMYKSIPISMSETMSLVNKEIIPMNDLNIFVSYFCMVINLKTGKARYANAGHDSPFIIKENGEVFQLKQGTGTFLGIFEHLEYSEEHYKFKKGDSILMYTDGVTEAMNKKNELFGKDKFIDELSGVNKTNSAEIIINNVNSAIAVHTKESPQSDDICMVCLKFK